MEEKKIGLTSVVSTGVGLVVSTSCLISLCGGASKIGTMFIVSIALACVLNMTTAASLAEMNALMPNMTGGLAQYTMAGLGYFATVVSMVGGYLICNCLTAPAEGAMFGLVMKDLLGVNIPSGVFAVAITLILMIVNLFGVDMFAKVQNVIAFLLIGSFLVLGICGTFKLSGSPTVVQPATTASVLDGIKMAATAFWLFIGVEFVIPIASDVKNPHKNIPLGMFLSLAIIAVIQTFMVLGLKNYVLYGDLAASSAPHMLYGVRLFGKVGKVWIGMISILAAISTQNSVINSIPRICMGMSKTNLLPQFFGKTNKYDTPYVGVLVFSAIIMIIEGTGLASTGAISFLVLTASVFWMISYIIIHIDVLVLRKRMPKVPRNFKVKGGWIVPIIGIVGTGYMVINISTDPAERLKIWLIVGVIFVLLSVYAVLWIKFKMKKPLFKAVPLHEVLAMENPYYYVLHYRREVTSGLNRKGRKKTKGSKEKAALKYAANDAPEASNHVGQSETEKTGAVTGNGVGASAGPVEHSGLQPAKKRTMAEILKPADVVVPMAEAAVIAEDSENAGAVVEKEAEDSTTAY